LDADYYVHKLQNVSLHGSMWYMAHLEVIQRQAAGQK